MNLPRSEITILGTTISASESRAALRATDVGTAGTFAAGTATTTQRVSYVGNQRYVRLFITADAATDVANSVGLIVRGKAARTPL